jgi:hypothetical protein
MASQAGEISSFFWHHWSVGTRTDQIKLAASQGFSTILIEVLFTKLDEIGIEGLRKYPPLAGQSCNLHNPFQKVRQKQVRQNYS